MTLFEKTGMYIYLNGKDVFMETSQTKRTDKLGREFVSRYCKAKGKKVHQSEVDAQTARYIWKRMTPATLKLKVLDEGAFRGMKYIDIITETGSFGCDACFNPFERVMVI